MSDTQATRTVRKTTRRKPDPQAAARREAARLRAEKAAAAKRRKQMLVGIGLVRTIAALASLATVVFVFIAAVPALYAAGTRIGLGPLAWTTPFVLDAALVTLIFAGYLSRAKLQSGLIQFVIGGGLIILSGWLQVLHLPEAAGPGEYALAITIPVALAAATFTFEQIVFGPIIEQARAELLAEREATAEAHLAAVAARQAAEADALAKKREADELASQVAEAGRALLVRATKSGDPEKIARAKEAIDAARDAAVAAPPQPAKAEAAAKPTRAKAAPRPRVKPQESAVQAPATADEASEEQAADAPAQAAAAAVMPEYSTDLFDLDQDLVEPEEPVAVLDKLEEAVRAVRSGRSNTRQIAAEYDLDVADLNRAVIAANQTVVAGR